MRILILGLLCWGCGATFIPMPGESWEVETSTEVGGGGSGRARTVMRAEYVGALVPDGSGVWVSDGRTVWRAGGDRTGALEVMRLSREPTQRDKTVLGVSEGYVWWQREEEHRIYRQKIDRGVPEKVLERQEGPETFRIWGSDLYWVEAGGLWGVRRGGSPHQISRSSPVLLAHAGNRLYWIEGDRAVLHWYQHDPMGSAGLTGSEALPEGSTTALSADDDGCYVLVWVVSRAGTEAWSLTSQGHKRLAYVAQPSPDSLEVAGTNLYWPNQQGGLWRLNREDGDLQNLDTPQAYRGLTASPTNLFWIGYTQQGFHVATYPL